MRLKPGRPDLATHAAHLGALFPQPQTREPALFLLSPAARFVVGQLLVTDGGVESLWRETDWPQPWDISTPRFLLKLFGPR